MKKVLKITISLLLVLSVFGCSKDDDTSTVNVDSNEKLTEVVSTRNIIISEINGTATVKHSNNESLSAYEGMSLFDGDDVVVDSGSNLTLDIDSDKHLFAEENTHFWLTATGKENSTKTIIHLDAGSVLCDIKNKLGSDEQFDVETTSTTMCVRGTVFRVSLLDGKDDSSFNLVQVFDGTVWSNTNDSNESVTLVDGQCALVDNKSVETGMAKIIHYEEINDDFNEKTGLNLSLQQAKDGEVGALQISLNDIPSETISKLIEIAEDGRDLYFKAEELNEVKETKEALSNVHDHNYVQTSYVAPSCTSLGSISYVCSICGDVKTNSLAMTPHTIATIHGKDETCTSNGLTDGTYCSVCGTTISPQGVIKAHGHNQVVVDNKIICSYCNEFFGYSGVDYVIDKDADGSGITSGKITGAVSGDTIVYEFSLQNVPLKNTIDSSSFVADSNVSATVIYSNFGTLTWSLTYDGQNVGSQGDVNLYFNALTTLVDAILADADEKITYSINFTDENYTDQDLIYSGQKIDSSTISIPPINKYYSIYKFNVDRSYDGTYFQTKEMYCTVLLVGDLRDSVFVATDVGDEKIKYYLSYTAINFANTNFDINNTDIDNIIKGCVYKEITKS